MQNTYHLLSDLEPNSGDWWQKTMSKRLCVDNLGQTVGSVTHLPKTNGRNDNKNQIGWDDEHDADMSIHLADEE